MNFLSDIRINTDRILTIDIDDIFLFKMNSLLRLNYSNL